MKFIDQQLSQKILTIGVSKAAFGGMAAVLLSYEKHFEKFRYIPTWRRGNIVLIAWYFFQAIVRCFLLLLFDWRIKIVHIHGSKKGSFYRKLVFIFMAKLFHKKVVYHQHAGEFQDYYDQSAHKKIIVNIINRCDKLVVLSQSWENFYLNIGVSKEKIDVLNNIVTPPDFVPARQSDGKLHLLYLGEIKNAKGTYDLLNVLKTNKEIFKDKILLRVGGIVVDGDFNAIISEKDLSPFIQYEGWVSGSKKTECLEWADVFILPSYYEGLPISILEAMSYSQPVIATNVGGIPEFLRSHENGILIEPGNLEQIKNAILYFVENPEKISEYGKKACKAVQPFFPDKVFEKLNAIYQELLV